MRKPLRFRKKHWVTAQELLWWGHLPQLENHLLYLERLVVGELDDVRLSLKQWLINIHLRVRVDAVVCYVEMLDDLGLRELVHNAPA